MGDRQMDRLVSSDKLIVRFKNLNTIKNCNTPLCVQRFEPSNDITVHVVPRKHFFKVSSILTHRLQNQQKSVKKSFLLTYSSEWIMTLQKILIITLRVKSNDTAINYLNKNSIFYNHNFKELPCQRYITNWLTYIVHFLNL